MDYGANHGSFDWLKQADIKVVAIVGISKNAGKTTLLNHLLGMNASQTFGVFSTGIDGEDCDTVFRTPKPKVHLGAGQVFCCDTPTLDGHGSSVTILEKLSFSCLSRPLWLARTEVPIQTEITGPSTVKDQIKTVQRMLNLGSEKILIDGSLDRKSIALSDTVDAVAVLIGASYGSLKHTVTEMKRLDLLNRIPYCADILKGSVVYKKLYESDTLLIRNHDTWTDTGIDSLIDSETQVRSLETKDIEEIFIPGAITDSVFATIRELLAHSGVKVILRHPDCLKLSYAKLEHFISDFEPKALIPFKIRSYALNTHAVGTQSIDAEEFRSTLRREFSDLNLPDIREGQL